MRFIILDRLERPVGAVPADDGSPYVELKRDNWNDYGFITRFEAVMKNAPHANTVRLGGVKIMQLGQTTDTRTYDLLDPAFDALGEDFCSIGQGDSFYTNLYACGRDLAVAYLTAARDVAYNPEIRAAFEGEEAYRISLLRTAGALQALDEAPAVFGEDRTVTVNKFDVVTRLEGSMADHRLSFDFTEQNGLPHRIAVLVGLNGVGKTSLMARLAFLISRYESENKEATRAASGLTFESLGTLSPRPSFYSAIAVSFSAFDDFEIPKVKETTDYQYAYCGLRKRGGGLRDASEIAGRAIALVEKMSEVQRAYLSSVIRSIIGRDDHADFIENPSGNAHLYNQLSSGQKIALNIVCELIVSIRKRSLILLDEPETHLHPQLLASLMAIVSDLLKGSDSFAIVATHSPIVVQQVPSRCVSVIKRVNNEPRISLPRVECFGENLTEIVRNIFDTTEADRDYQNIIDDLIEANNNNVEVVEALFERGLGLNARLYLHATAVA